MEYTYRFPLEILLKGRKFFGIDDDEEVKETAEIIQRVFYQFGIRADVVNAKIGTRFVRYEVKIEKGVRIRSVLKLKDDIKMATRAISINIEAPIAGESLIGIDIENSEKHILRLRDVIETKEFSESDSCLICAAGRGITGNAVIINLEEIPHLLIGGATGSGKTVFISSLIMSVLCKATPEDVKILMIDTKGVNLSLFNGIPHLLIPVVVNAEKALSALQWVLKEIQNRYSKFANCGVRDIKEYNCSDKTGRGIARILVIIDDLSDLMALHKSEAEQIIVRITQISRVTGVYLVISTQRPSTNVVTGLIKANIPNRIAFSVFSAVDSRVILDEKGAEKLSGNGDMLFKQQGYQKPERIQGTYVSDIEICKVVDYFRNQ